MHTFKTISIQTMRYSNEDRERNRVHVAADETTEVLSWTIPGSTFRIFYIEHMNEHLLLLNSIKDSCTFLVIKYILHMKN